MGRSIREQQDQAYQRSLEADRLKAEAKLIEEEKLRREEELAKAELLNKDRKKEVLNRCNCRTKLNENSIFEIIWCQNR